jgi:tetratricopeptide (TPR) repeat protein
VLGTGAGTHLFYGRLFRRPQIQVDPEHAHSDYLELLAEYGLVGEALAIFFLVVHIGQGMKTARQVTARRLCNIPGMGQSDTLALTLGALSACAALLAHSVVDFNMHIPGNAVLFAFLFAVLGSGGMEKAWEDRATRPETLARGVLALAGLGLLVAITLRYPAERLSNQARTALEAADYDECIRLAELAIAKDPANPQTYFYQGEAYRALAASMPSYSLREEYFKQAIEAYRKGIASFPQNENLWIRLGQCLDGTLQYAEAQQAYLNAIASDPNLGILYAYYAAHLRLVGDLEGAEQCEDAARDLGATDLEKIGMGEPPTFPKTHSEEKLLQK